MDLRDIWDLPDRLPERTWWKFYYKKDRQVRVEVVAESYEKAWERLAEVLKGR